MSLWRRLRAGGAGGARPGASGPGSRPARRLFLHVGTHKTGTTSLQRALSTRADALAALGLLYPRCGRPPEVPHGHHNLAWEITGDRRFRRAHGAAADLLAEIGRAPHDVILSSEDFECSLQRTAAFAAWVRRLQSAAFEITALVYLREQADYACTLFLTLLHAAFDRPFEAFLAEILERGACTHRDSTISLCYRELLARLTAVPGLRVIVRSYHEASRPSVVPDALGLFGLPAREIAGFPELHLNERMGVRQAVELFSQHRLRRALSADEKRLADWLGATLGSRPLVLASRSRQRLRERFAASNRAIEERHGLAPLAGPSPTGDPAGAGLCMDTLFSAALPAFIETAARNRSRTGCSPELPVWLAAASSATV